MATETKPSVSEKSGDRPSTSGALAKTGPKREDQDVSLTEEEREKLLPRPIKTGDDAVYAFLNGRIEEDELRKCLAAFGVTTLQKTGVERVDAAYERKIPEDLFDVPTAPYDDHEYRMEILEAKENEKQEAVAATEGETRDETVAREQSALQQKLLTGETGTEAGREAADKALEKKNVDKPSAVDPSNKS